MNKLANIVVVGSINMDLVIDSPRIPVSGETIMGRSFSTIPGGKGANQAIAARRLGARVNLVGCVGDDEFGRHLLNHFKQERIDIDYVKVLTDSSTGIASITVSNEGDNSIVLAPGANWHLTPKIVQQAELIIKQADILLVQLEIPLDAVQEAVKIANKHNIPIILNPAPAQELPDSLFNEINIITPNETEGQLLTTKSINECIDAKEIIHKLHEKGVEKIVLTQGSKGVAYSESGQIATSPANRVEVVDTTAAGDAFNAGLSVGLAEGMQFNEAIQFAQKVSALTVTKFGAQSSLPKRIDVEQFIEKT